MWVAIPVDAAVSPSTSGVKIPFVRREHPVDTGAIKIPKEHSCQETGASPAYSKK